MKVPANPIDFLNMILDTQAIHDYPTVKKIVSISVVKYVNNKSFIKTAAVMVGKPITLVFNTEFLEKEIRNVEDAVCLLYHELTHLSLRHFNRDVTKIFKDEGLQHIAANVVLDCQVNATLFHALEPNYHQFLITNYSDKRRKEQSVLHIEEHLKDQTITAEDRLKLDESLKEAKQEAAAIPNYRQSTEMPWCLLRPGSTPPAEFQDIYTRLYSPYGVTTKELLEVLKPWMEKQDKEMLDRILQSLLGNHNDGDGVEVNSDIFQGYTKDLLKNLKDKLGDKLKQGNKPGKSDIINKIEIELDSQVFSSELKRAVKKSYSISPARKIFKAITDLISKTSQTSVIPNFYDPRTASLFALGKMPVFHRNPKPTSRAKVHCYVDVSGSQDHVIPQVIPAVYKVKKEVGDQVYCFSNVVVDTKLEKLISGTYYTTGGTDFNPVFEHALKNRFKKILILTDGEAGLSQDLASKAKQRGMEITVGWTVASPSKEALQSIATKEFYVFSEQDDS